MNLALAEPNPALSTTTYCLANPGTEYLIYQPSANRKFAVQLSPGTYHLEWFNPAEGTLIKSESIESHGDALEFNAPFNGGAVLYLKAKNER